MACDIASVDGNRRLVPARAHTCAEARLRRLCRLPTIFMLLALSSCAVLEQQATSGDWVACCSRTAQELKASSMKTTRSRHNLCGRGLAQACARARSGRRLLSTLATSQAIDTGLHRHLPTSRPAI